jgi:hypothetical protein
MRAGDGVEMEAERSGGREVGERGFDVDDDVSGAVAKGAELGLGEQQEGDCEGEEGGAAGLGGAEDRAGGEAKGEAAGGHQQDVGGDEVAQVVAVQGRPFRGGDGFDVEREGGEQDGEDGGGSAEEVGAAEEKDEGGRDEWDRGGEQEWQADAFTDLEEIL